MEFEIWLHLADLLCVHYHTSGTKMTILEHLECLSGDLRKGDPQGLGVQILHDHSEHRVE